MKPICTLLFLLTFSVSSNAQVQCIKCYNQNARILTDTNNLILNGGFENTTCIPLHLNDTSFCPNSAVYHCDIANWLCTGGGSGTYADVCDATFSTIVEGNLAVYFGNSTCEICSDTINDVSCMTNIGCEVTGIPEGYPYNPHSGFGGNIGVSLQQTVNGLTPGANYMLEFWAGGEWGSTFTRDGIFAVDVGFGNIFLKDPKTPKVTGVGRRYVIVFTPADTSDIIKFTNWGHIYKATELILDDVRLFQSDSSNSQCVSEIDELSENATTVFPNPAANQFIIATNTHEPAEIILHDITSRQLMLVKFIGSTTLNVENLAKGIYLYEIRDEKGGIERGKVVKK